MFKVYNNDVRTTSMVLFWCLYYHLLTSFIPFPNVSIGDFEQVKVAGLEQIWRLVKITLKQLNLQT